MKHLLKLLFAILIFSSCNRFRDEKRSILSLVNRSIGLSAYTYKVILVGNPINNPKIEKMFKEIVEEKLDDKRVTH